MQGRGLGIPLHLLFAGGGGKRIRELKRLLEGRCEARGSERVMHGG